MDSGALRDLFAPDGEWIVTGYGEPRGHDEIVAFLDGLLANWSGIVHALLSGTVTFDTTDPFRATGRWYISEFGQYEERRRSVLCRRLPRRVHA